MISNISIDFEEWYHSYCPSKWASFSSNIEHNTDKILELLDNFKIKANFFCVGYVANRYPHLINQISNNGHIVDSHSYWHKNLELHNEKSFNEIRCLQAAPDC